MHKLNIVNISQNDPSWLPLVREALNIADHIEFNVLFKNPGRQLEELLADYDGAVVTPADDRLYSNGGQRVSFPNTPAVATWIASKKFEDWSGFLLEDPSFIKSTEEILGTISHEMLYGISSNHLPDSPVA
jgi:hypothetical protein